MVKKKKAVILMGGVNCNGNVILEVDGLHLVLIMKFMERIITQMKKCIEQFVKHLVKSHRLISFMSYFLIITLCVVPSTCSTESTSYP